MNDVSKSKIIYQQRINKVIDYLQQNLDKSVALKELAKIAHFSPFHFHRIFVAVTGQSVHFFTNRLRLEKSARLLKFANQSIADTAKDCGFSSPATFSRSFKSYYGIKPSLFKKTGKIENSKICKELFPLEDYLVPMDDVQLRKTFPVEVKAFAERRIAYMRIKNSFQEGVVLTAFRKMVDWAKTKNLFERETIFGMSIDDPFVTPQEQYIYEVCITLPEDFQLEDEMLSMTIPSCKYAVTRVSGDMNLVATATHYLWNTWLINSKYEPEHQHGLEIYLKKENMLDWSHFDLDLCIAVKNLKYN